MSLESDRRAFLDDWSNDIGPVGIPHCAACQKDCETLSFDADVERQEYQFITTCHGDTEVYHIDFRYAAQIAARMQEARFKAAGDEKNLRWKLIPAFQGIEDRVNGKLHYDYLQALQQKIARKETPDISEAEKDAKAEFEDSFKFEEKRGNVIVRDVGAQ